MIQQTTPPLWTPPQAPPPGTAQAWPQSQPPQAPYPGSPPGAAPQWGPVFRPDRRDPRRLGASRALNRMSLLALAQVGLSFVWQIPLMLLLALLGVDILTNDMGYLWLSAALVPLSTALPFVAYLALGRKDPAACFKFQPVGFTGGMLCVLAGLAVALLGNYPAVLVQDFLSNFGYESSAGYVSQAETWPAILLEFAVVAVLVPFLEELVFRGVVLSSLRPYGIGFSIVASALVFGLAHLDISSVTFAIVAGLAMGFIYARTNNLWLTVAIHALNNAIAVASSHTEFFFGEDAVLAGNLLVLLPIGLGVLSMLMLLLFKRDVFITRRSPRYDGPAAPLGPGMSAAAIGKAPAFWVTVGLVLLYTLTLFFTAP